MTRDDDAPGLGRLFALLSDPARFKVAAAVALGAATIQDIVAQTHLDRRVVEKSLGRMSDAGLLVHDPSGYRVPYEEFAVAVRSASKVDRAAPADEREAVLMRFFDGTKLRSIPTVRSKRLVVLDHIVQDFDPGRRYKERAVNDMLRNYYDDVASLRRYLVDEGLLSRAGGYYWRSGGTFEVD